MRAPTTPIPTIPTNNSGAARILHLDKNGKFINQWFGNAVGQGKFTMAHGFAVDPRTGDVYIGDREEYRIVVYTGDGKFLRTMQLRNLICALYFDKQNNLWVASGWDGQFLKVSKQTGQVLGAIGNGNGTGAGQFLEASYLVDGFPRQSLDRRHRARPHHADDTSTEVRRGRRRMFAATRRAD